MNKKMRGHSGLPTITGYSTALFSTWYFCDEMGVLFDCGDGLTSGLMQKARKIKRVFLSHADRDHLAGLLQFNQLNARQGLKIYYPKDCGSFAHLAEFCSRFDPHMGSSQWIPLVDGSEIRIREDLSVRAMENAHVQSKEGCKSLTYFVDAISRKLKPELVGKEAAEISALRKESGEEAISNLSRTTKLVYSGDTPIENDGRYNNAQVLIHEATFLTAEEIEPGNPRRNKHSSLDQVIAMVAQSNIQHLVLGHFSSRYDHQQIDEAIRKECRQHKLTIPVYRVLPGMLSRGILSSPLNLQVN